MTLCSLRSQCHGSGGHCRGGVGQKMGRIPGQRRKGAHTPTTTRTAVLVTSYWLELHGTFLWGVGKVEFYCYLNKCICNTEYLEILVWVKVNKGVG